MLRTCLHFVCFGKLYCQYLRYFELLISFTSHFFFSGPHALCALYLSQPFSVGSKERRGDILSTLL